MINHDRVRSTIEPERLTIDEYSVWVADNIEQVEVEEEIINDENEIETVTTIMYEYDLVQYTKDEYILMQTSQMTDVEMALVEIYESLGV